MFYFAYGSNLLKSGMRERCPAANSAGRAVLPGHRFVFRSWADVETAAGGHVAGGLWRITPACLLALDAYEEVESGLYRRWLLDVETEGGEIAAAFVYRMCATTYDPPDADYLAVVLGGCRDFGLENAPVFAAVESARARGS